MARVLMSGTSWHAGQWNIMSIQKMCAGWCRSHASSEFLSSIGDGEERVVEGKEEIGAVK